MDRRMKRQSGWCVTGLLAAVLFPSATSQSSAQSPSNRTGSGAGAEVRAQYPPWLKTGTPQVPKTTASDVYKGDVRITATIDGADVLRIYRNRAEWQHESGEWPEQVKINGVEWSPRENAKLANADATTFMPVYTVLFGATHWKLHGRSPVKLTVKTDHLELQFNDPGSGADTYDVVVHQGEVFPQIEISEANEKRVADLFANAPWTPHPTGQKPGVRPDLRTVLRDWRRRRLTLDYERHGRRDPIWDDAARAFLDDAVPFPDEAPVDKMIAAGARLIEAGCNDPLVCFVYGYQLLRAERPADAEPFLFHAVLDFEQLKYPRRASRLAPALLAKSYMQQSTDRSALAYALVQRALEEAVEAVRGPFEGDERRALLAELRHGVGRGTGRVLTDREPALLRMLQDSVDADPWIVHLLISDYQYVQGWTARGGGDANTVSEEGRQILGTLLKQSKARRVAAWAEHPEYPEAATGMIMITRAAGGVGDETPRFWFDQAVAAQFDAPRAHEWLIWVLRPRWGGSHKEMLDFGMECLRTGRFDTDVPEFFFHAVYGIYEEDGDLPALVAALNADDEIRRGMRTLEDSQTGKQRHAIVTRNMILAWRLGWNDEVRRRLGELDGRFDAGTERAWAITGKGVRQELEYPAPSTAEAPIVEPTGTLFEKRGNVGSLDVAPNGEHVAVNNYLGKQLLTIWNVTTGQPKEIAPERKMAIYSLRFSPDSAWVAALQIQRVYRIPNDPSEDKSTGMVTLWETKTGASRSVSPDGHKLVDSFDWLPQGRYLVLGVPHRALVVDSETNNVLAATDLLKDRVTAVTVSPVEPLLVVGCESGMLKLFRLPTATELGRATQPLELSHLIDMPQHIARVDYLAFSRDGSSLASSGRDGRSVWIWDVRARQPRRRVQGYQIAFSPDGRFLATAGGETLRQEAVLWNVSTGDAVTRCSYPGLGRLVGVSFTADGELLVAPSGEGTIYTWKANR